MSAKEQRIGEIVAEHHGREGPLLPILHDVQHEFGCVDAESEAAHDREPRIGQRARNRMGVTLPLRSGVAGADDGHAVTFEQAGVAYDKEDAGRAVDLPQLRRVLGVLESEQAMSIHFGPLDATLEQRLVGPQGECLRDVRLDGLDLAMAPPRRWLVVLPEKVLLTMATDPW